VGPRRLEVHLRVDEWRLDYRALGALAVRTPVANPRQSDASHVRSSRDCGSSLVCTDAIPSRCCVKPARRRGAASRPGVRRSTGEGALRDAGSNSHGDAVRRRRPFRVPDVVCARAPEVVPADAGSVPGAASRIAGRRSSAREGEHGGAAVCHRKVSRFRIEATRDWPRYSGSVEVPANVTSGETAGQGMFSPRASEVRREVEGFGSN
jgi:hypothetical protein